MPAPDLLRSHLAEAFRWSDDTRLDGGRIVFSLASITIPVVIGFWAGHPSLGYVIGLGAMLLAGEQGERADCHSHTLIASLVPVLLAVAAAAGIARLPFADVFMIALVIPAATLVNYSRPAAVGGIRFIVFLVLNLGLIAGHGPQGRGAALMFGIGALWRLALRLIARHRRIPAELSSDAVPAERQPTSRQRRVHLGRMLRSWQGWQYPVRLGLGLAAACAIRDRWPGHHFDWMVLSIALLTPRALEHVPVHITQRAVGTLIGVVLAGIVLYVAPGHAVIAGLVCLFGTLAPLLRSGNYAAYCIFATPLILLAMDADGALEPGTLVDRLVATLVGSLIVVGANVLMDRMLRGVRPAKPQ
ncbi:Predicted membrane protein [Luteibacter sp. 22Crub2.1]|nr:Predicted membrane protein [Luteibacter sp. 22Crub2.1]